MSLLMPRKPVSDYQFTDSLCSQKLFAQVYQLSTQNSTAPQPAKLQTKDVLLDKERNLALFGWLSLHTYTHWERYLKSRDGTGRAQKSRTRGWMVGGPPVNL